MLALSLQQNEGSQLSSKSEACPLPVNMLYGYTGIAPYPMPYGSPEYTNRQKVQLPSNTAEAMQQQNAKVWGNC